MIGACQRRRAVEPARIARPRRQDDPGHVRPKHVRRGRGVRQHPDPRPAATQRAHDVRLEAVVDDRDQRATVARLVRRSDRYPADEVLVLPARQRVGTLHGRVWVRLAGGGDDAPLAAGLAQVARQRPRIQTGDRGHALGPQQVHDLARPAEHGRGRVADHEAAQPGSLGLVVTREAAVVADERDRS